MDAHQSGLIVGGRTEQKLNSCRIPILRMNIKSTTDQCVFIALDLAPARAVALGRHTYQRVNTYIRFTSEAHFEHFPWRYVGGDNMLVSAVLLSAHLYDI